MSRYDVVEQLHLCMAQLEQELDELQQQMLNLRLLAARVFELPAIEKGKEHDPLTQIAVTQLTGQQALQRAFSHYGRLFMQHQSEKLSTKAAVRLPGAICLEADNAQSALLRQQTGHINQLKLRLEQLITIESGLPSEERFEFVHAHLRGLITLNAYRSIVLIEDADSVRFGWANKHVIKKVSIENMLEKLQKSQQSGRAVAPWTREQWAERVAGEIETLKSLPPGAALKIKRPVKVQPIARIWQAQQQKQVQLACPSPLLVICPDANSVPALGELRHYDAGKVTHRFKPDAQPLHLIIPRLHLYSDRLA
ncbi:DNA replication terminus site-binding protein [Erwinia amylovora]|uniref:DNA replication terminus site-binding protein n=2 Tax=Erwinia amylovora TaxID=552 RepID=A0A830ZZT0_ERWAM|nr:DNA replication terminus site-binding protein [Erwinia amylovora]CDK15227.1 DNA replication terminus site-binding protein [Erwinia amylovora LA635]CDK18594.1 DNA replication terminus site-binding protein [Erwinia amylovora LA636]CDK21963.1 DNA replication terminus site-binding protein [Erwinia amylovora LA637]ATZ11537.1 DNA replication terminus site-binding protein [Erwinia amylovora]EKV54437.1 DNA replication terminus site-binding protein [Erwinia amylovora ACW56400]